MDKKEKYAVILKTKVIPFVNEMLGIIPTIKNLHWKNEGKAEHEALDQVYYEVTNLMDSLMEQVLSQCGRECLNYGEIEALTYDEVYSILDFGDLVDYITKRMINLRTVLESLPEMVGVLSQLDNTVQYLNIDKYRGTLQ